MYLFKAQWEVRSSERVSPSIDRIGHWEGEWRSRPSSELSYHSVDGTQPQTPHLQNVLHPRIHLIHKISRSPTTASRNKIKGPTNRRKSESRTNVGGRVQIQAGFRYPSLLRRWPPSLWRELRTGVSRESRTGKLSFALWLGTGLTLHAPSCPKTFTGISSEPSNRTKRNSQHVRAPGITFPYFPKGDTKTPQRSRISTPSKRFRLKNSRPHSTKTGQKTDNPF